MCITIQGYNPVKTEQQKFEQFKFTSSYIKRGKVSVMYVRNGGRGQLSSE